MENGQWRPRARIVAWLEFLLPAAALVHVIYEVSTANEYTHWLVWTSISVMVIEAAAEIWAAVTLLGATNTETEADECLRRGGNWRIVLVTIEVIDVIMIILEIWQSLYNGTFWRTIIMVILHGAFIFVVESFMSETRSSANSNNQGAPAPAAVSR